jgi:predicted  nucleic acid-binding Zn-ribbon protein
MKDPLEFQCLECGKRMTQRQAERAMDRGCTNCGGSDVDQIASLRPKKDWDRGNPKDAWN